MNQRFCDELGSRPRCIVLPILINRLWRWLSAHNDKTSGKTAKSTSLRLIWNPTDWWTLSSPQDTYPSQVQGKKRQVFATCERGGSFGECFLNLILFIVMICEMITIIICLNIMILHPNSLSQIRHTHGLFVDTSSPSATLRQIPISWGEQAWKT